MKLKRYAEGGIIYTPYVSPSTVSSPTTSGAVQSSSGQTATQEDDWKVKKMVEMIQKNGLISDVNATMDNLKVFWNAAQNMSTNQLFGGDKTYDIMANLFDIQKEINANVVNYKNWETAQQNAYQKGTLGEVAITPGGNIYVWTEKGITSVTPKEYSENAGTGVYYDYNGDGSDYLTNNEVLDIRNRYVSGNTSLISNVSSAVGLHEIEETIRTIVKDFGTESRTEYIKRTGNQISQSAWNGMQILLGEGPDGYYKVTTKSEREYVDAAVKHLWDVIGASGKNKIIANVAAKGGDPTKPEEIFSIILNALQLHTDFSHDANFEKGATEYDPDGDGKGNSSSSALGEVPYLVRIGRGDGERELVNISMRTDSVMQSGAMMAWASNMGNLIDKNGNTIGMDSLPNILTKAEAIKATRSKDITFGGQLLNDIEKNFIVYDGTSQVTDVWLPFKNIGGKIAPDFDKLQKFNEWNDWVHKNPGITKVEKMNEAYKRGLDPEEMIYDETTGMFQFKPQKMKLFLSFSAYADNDNIDFTKLTKDLTEEVPIEFGRKYKDVFNNLFEYGKMHRQKSDKKVGLNYDKVRGWDLRRGNIFIPIDSDFLAMHMSMTEYAPKSEMNQFAARSTATRQMNYNQDPTISTLGQFM